MSNPLTKAKKKTLRPTSSHRSIVSVFAAGYPIELADSSKVSHRPRPATDVANPMLNREPTLSFDALAARCIIEREERTL